MSNLLTRCRKNKTNLGRMFDALEDMKKRIMTEGEAARRLALRYYPFVHQVTYDTIASKEYVFVISTICVAEGSEEIIYASFLDAAAIGSLVTVEFIMTNEFAHTTLRQWYITDALSYAANPQQRHTTDTLVQSLTTNR